MTRQAGALAHPRAFQAQGETDGPEFNIGLYWHLILKHRWLIASALVGALAIGLVITLLTTPIYRATATVQIDREAANVMNIEDVEPTSSTSDRDYYQTQYALMRSRSLAERVVDRLNLADNEAFLGQRSGGGLRGLLRKLTGRSAPKPTTAADRAARETRAVGILLSNLAVEPVRGSRLVKVQFDSPNPQIAARISNAIAENVIAANLDRRFEASSYAREFLEERLGQVKAKLEASERELVAYAASQQLISVQPSSTRGDAEATASTSLAASNLVAMNAALAAAKGERIRAEQRWRQAQNVSGLALPEIMQSPTVQSLRSRRAELQSEYQEKLGVYKPDFPAMLQLKAEMGEVERQIAAETENVKQSIRSEYEVARNQEASLQQQVSNLTSGVLDQRSRSIQYNILQREVDTNRTLYDGLLQRYKEIGVAGGLGANNISIVDRALPPGSPHTPNLPLNLLIAAAVGLLLGAGTALALESLDETIKVPEDIEQKLGIPLLGSTPALEKGATPAAALNDTRSPFSEAYHSIRTALQFSTDQGVPSNILVTSARPSEGKSTSALALARNFAKLGMKVLLIDADLRNPSLHRALGCPSDVGLSNYLTGRAPLSGLVQITDEPNLACLPCGPLPPNPAELLAGGKINALIREANAVFDLIVFDGPPVMGLADAPLLASVVSGTVLIIEAGTTRQGLVRAAMRRLALGNARILGAILTKFSARRAGYGYGYGYGYAYSYDYGAKRLETK